MAENLKAPGIKKNRTAQAPDLLEKTETFLARMPGEYRSDPEILSTLEYYARELEENPDLVDLLQKKALTLLKSFPLWCLTELNVRIQSKIVKKGIKKILYLLKQKGYEPPPAISTSEKPEGSILKQIDPVSTEAYLSDFDGLKNQMAGLLIPKRSQGRLFVFALITSQGLESMTALEVSKREVKDILTDLENRSGLRFHQADLNHAAFLVMEAHDRDSQLSKDDEKAYQEVIKLLEEKAIIGQSPIIRTLMDKEKVVSRASDSHQLLKVPEIFYLLPEKEILESYLQAIQGAQSGILILNEIQKKERVQDIIEKAVRESFPLVTRFSLFRYLEELAYLYLLKKKPQEAEAIFYWANTLGEDRDQGRIQEPPFLLWLMETVLLSQESGPLPSPETQEHTTDGGIILPGWVKREDFL